MGEELDKNGLRKLAKKRLEGRPVQERSADENVKLVEELSLHQEELNIQNEELRRIQLELETTNAKYFELYDLAPVGYLTLTPDLMIKESNLSASTLLGTERKELINKPLSSFVSPRSQESLYLHYRRLEQGHGKQVHTFFVRRKDGKELQLQFESNIVEEGSGRGFRSILTDVTELRRAQQAQKELSENLERSNADLEQFAHVASHDLQEPLRMITAYLSLINKKYGDELNDQAKGYMSQVVDGAERMKRLIDDLLQYSRIDTKSRPFSSVDMNRVAEKVLVTLHIVIRESNAEVIVGPLPAVMGDEALLAQVLQNLIGNALKYRGPEPPRVQVSAVRDDGEWLFSVSDNGIGIDPKHKDRIFQMFQRLHTREEYTGTGIGLAIAKKIVERHGGRIWVESDGKNGSTFHFTVPVQSPM